MLQKIKIFLTMYSAVIICGIITGVAPLILNECEFFWYQEEEPEEIMKFFNKKKVEDFVL